MPNIKLFIIFVLFMPLFNGCGVYVVSKNAEEKNKKDKIEFEEKFAKNEIPRQIVYFDTLFMREVNHYSAARYEGKKILLDEIWACDIVSDINTNEKMYYEYYGEGFFGIKQHVTIHIRSINDMHGAGWSSQNGKTINYGTTTRIGD